MADNLDDLEIAEAFGQEASSDDLSIPFEEDIDSSQPSEEVEEIFGSPGNIARHGSPSDRHLRYYFYPTWRSQMFPLIGYFILCFLAVSGSHHFDATVIKGKLFPIGDTTYMLHLPLLALLPGFMLGKVLIFIYDSKYIIDERGVEAQVGLVSLQLRQPRLRWEDIRGVEPVQSIWERIIGIGKVLVGSAMTQDVEIVMFGVANPRAIQLLISGERDQRLKSLQGNMAMQSQVLGD